MSPALERLEAALRAHGSEPKGGTASCPAHEDKHASLSVSEGTDGRALVHCHAGCTFEAIVAALGLEARDLMRDNGKRPVARPKAKWALAPVPREGYLPDCRLRDLGEPVLTWIYRDARRRLVGVVARYQTADGKTFRPWTYGALDGGKPGWRQRTWPTPRPLYGVDRLTARPAAPVLVCEGEKACDAAEKLLGELVVVTSPGGADTAKHADWTPLAGRRVTVWPDNDAPGATYAADVARLVRQAGAESVAVVSLPADLPDKWDLADALPAAWTAETVRELIREANPAAAPTTPTPEPAARVQIITAAELRTREFKPLREVVPGILAAGLALLAGAPKLGKSWLALLLALAKALGGKALGVQVTAAPVLFVGLEDSLRRLQQRLNMLLEAGEEWPENLLLADGQAFPWKAQAAVDQLRRFHDQRPDLALIVLDTLGRLREDVGRRGSGYDLDIAFAAPFQALAVERELCLLGLHHTRKRDRRYAEVDGLEAISGTLALPGCADGVLVLQRGRMAREGELLVTGRDLPERKMALRFEPSCGLWTYQGEAQQVAATKGQQDILDALRDSAAPMSIQDVARVTSRRYDTAKHLLLRLVEAGAVVRFGPGTYALPTPSTSTTHPMYPMYPMCPECPECPEESGDTRGHGGDEAVSRAERNAERASPASGTPGIRGTLDCDQTGTRAGTCPVSRPVPGAGEVDL